MEYNNQHYNVYNIMFVSIHLIERTVNAKVQMFRELTLSFQSYVLVLVKSVFSMGDLQQI
jgi:hypothetical protein